MQILCNLNRFSVYYLHITVFYSKYSVSLFLKFLLQIDVNYFIQKLQNYGNDEQINVNHSHTDLIQGFRKFL